MATIEILEAEGACSLPLGGGHPGHGLLRRHALGEEVLGALTDLGVLTKDAAREWSTREQRAWDRPRRRRLRRDPEERRRAKEVLERLLADVTPFVDQPRREGWSIVSDAFSGALAALREVGLLDARQHDRWHERWHRALEQGWEPCDDYDPASLPAAVDLLAVVPPAELPVDTSVRLTCAELYADCVSIAWQLVIPQPEWKAGRTMLDVKENRVTRTFERVEAVAIALTDDVGTNYRAVGPSEFDDGIEGRHSTASWSATVFEPAVPPRASRLEATAGAYDPPVTFDLTG